MQDPAENRWARTGVDHQNVSTLRGGLEAYLGGDFGSMQKLFAEDVVIHINGYPDNPWTGDHRGREGLRYLFSLSKDNQEEERWEVEGYTASDNFAVLLVKMAGTRQGRTAEIPVVQVFRLDKGRCTECWYLTSEDYFRPDQEYWADLGRPPDIGKP